MGFPAGFLEEIKSRLALSAIVGRRVPLKRQGRDWKGCCPFHKEKTPSFVVHDDKGYYYCFGCQAKGDHVTFVMAMERLEFRDAVESLAGLAGLEVPEDDPETRRRAQRSRSALSVLEEACAWFTRQLQGAAGEGARAYLARRGVSPETARAFRLGWAPGGSALTCWAAQQGIDVATLAEVGLARPSDRGGEPWPYFRERLIFPVLDRRERVVAFGGRLLGPGEPKYLNSPDTPYFSKGATLYGLAGARRAVADGAPLIVAEGYMDVVALVQGGFAGAVAPLGTAVTEEQLGLLWASFPGGSGVPILCLDGDRAGRAAAERAAERAVPLLKPGSSLAFAWLPDGEDPDSLLRQGGRPRLEAAIGKPEPLAAFLFRRACEQGEFTTPEGRAAVQARLEATVTRIADRTVQTQYRRDLNDRLWARLRGGERVPAPRPRVIQGGLAGPGRAALSAPGASGATGPATPAGDPRAAADRRRARTLLALLLAAPALLPEVLETLADLEPADEGDARLRDALVAGCDAIAGLDSGAACNHLRQLGLLGEIAALGSSVAAAAGGPGRTLDLAAARVRWSRALDELETARMAADLRSAQRDLGAATTDETWDRFVRAREAWQMRIDAAEADDM